MEITRSGAPRTRQTLKRVRFLGFYFSSFGLTSLTNVHVLSALLQSPTIGSRQSIPHSIYDESVLAPKKMTYGCSAARPPEGRARNEGEDGQCLPFKAQGPPPLPLSSGDGDTCPPPFDAPAARRGAARSSHCNTKIKHCPKNT